MPRNRSCRPMWETKNPIPRLGERLKEEGLATDDMLANIEQEVVALINEAVAFAEESPSPEPTDTLKHVFYPNEDWGA